MASEGGRRSTRRPSKLLGSKTLAGGISASELEALSYQSAEATPDQEVLATSGVWQKIYDANEYKPFYYNLKTEESMWERPASFGWESAADEESGERFWLFEDDDQAYLWANPAWQAGVDEESGNRYWHNVDTDESTWDRPDDYASDTESERVSMEEGAKQRRALREAAARKAKKASKPPPPPPPPAAPDSQPQPASDPSSPPPPPPPAAGPAEPAIAPGSGSGDGGALPSSRGGQAQKAVRKAAVVVLASDSEASDFEEEDEDQVHATATRRVTKVSRGSGVTVKRKKATGATAGKAGNTAVPGGATQGYGLGAADQGTAGGQGASLPPPPPPPPGSSGGQVPGASHEGAPPPPPAASSSTDAPPPPPAPVAAAPAPAPVASTEPLPPLNDALSTRLLQRIATDSTLRQGIPILKFAGPSDLTAARQVLSDSVARVAPGEEVAVEGELAAGGAVLVLDGDMDVTSEGTTRAAGPGTVLFGDTLLSGSSRYEGSLRAREQGRGAYVARLALHAMQAALGQDWLVQRGRQALESDASMLPTLLQPVPFLAAHREASAPVLMELSLVVQRPALHLVIQEGAPVDGFFVLLLGSARVAVEGRVVAECGPGAFFGEMSMLGTGGQGGGAAAAGAGAGPSSSSSSGGKLASASVVTTSPSLLLCVPRRSFGELLYRCPGVADELQKHAIRRTALNLKGLGAASPLALATEAQLQALAARASIETVPAGRPVARRGDPRGHVTVVLSGTVEEQGFEPARPSSSDPMPALTGETKQRKPGDIVSASVLFEDCPASVPADAVVAGGEPARLMRFGSQDFAAAMGGAGSAAMAAVLLRLRGGSPRARDIAAVPALSEALVKFGGSSKVRKGSVQLLGAAKKFRLLARGLAPRAGVVDVPSPDMVAAARAVEAVLQDPLEGPALQAVMGQPLYDECGKKLHASLHAAHRRRFSMMPGAGAASGAGAGGGASGGDGQRAGPMPVGLLDGAAAALDAHLAEIVSEFVDSPMYAACMRRVAESLADGGADAAGADGDSGPGSVTGGDGLGGSRRSSRLDGGAMKEPSFSQWFGVEKLNRYGQWQPRALRLHLVERQLLVHRSKTEAEQHNFDATDVAKVVRVATEQRDQLRLGFRPELEEKDYDLKFEGGETGRDDFVRMLQMLGGSTLLVEDEGEDYSSQGTGLFLTQKVGKGALFVAVQPDARILVHGSDRSAVQASAKAAEDAALLGSGDPLSAAAHAAVSVGSAGADVKSVRITWRTLIHPCNLDPTRAVVCPHGEEAPIPRAPVAPERKSTAPRSGRRLSSLIDIMGNKSGGPLWGAAHPGGADKGSMELIFSSPQARDRFTGLLRAVSEGIDIPLARATGVRRLAAAAAQEPGRESATAHRLTREGVLVCAATWNVGDSKPPKDPSELWPWLPPGRFDIYAIGLQECSSLQSWVSTICDAISSSDATSATGAGAGAAAGGAKSAPSADANGAPSDALEYLKSRPGNFALVASHSLWEMQLLVFAREDVARTVSQLKQSSVATGLGGIIGNKGGVACGMVLGGTTRLCFMTCHLAARATRLRTRASNFAEILRRLEVGLTAQGTPANQALHDYDHFFVMGDLNYRVDLGFHGSPTEFQTVQRHIDAMDFAPLEAADQLVHQKVRGNVFAGFDEQPIRFAPTYRMVKGKALTYSNKRNQNMSWTDRVLWRSAGALRGGVQPVFYASCFSLDNSDHRPVSAGVRVPMRQPYLHLDRGLGAGSARQVVLELGGAELFDAPLSPTEQEAADAGMGAATGSPVSRSQCPKGLMELAGPDKAVKAAAELASDKKASKKGKQSAVAPPKPGKMPDAKSAARMAAEAQGVALDAGGIPRSCGPSGKRKGFDFKAGEGLFLTVSAPFVGSTAASGVVPAQDAGTLVARWSGAQLPHAVMRLADESWIAEQSVLLTVRRSTGQIVGQAELSLLDARAHASDPYGSLDGLTLARVLEHPTLLRALAAFLQMEQTPEHLAFLLVTRWYRETVLEVGRMVREGAGPDEVASAMAGAVGIAAMRGAAKEAKEDAQAAAKGKGKGKAKGNKKKGKSAASLGLGGTDEASTPGLGGKWLGQMVRRARHKGKAAIAVRVQSTGGSAAAATGAGTGDSTGLPSWALSHVHAAARAIAQEYVGGGMPSEVNVPGSMSKAARAIVLEDMLGACSLGEAEPGSDSGWTAERAAGVFDTCAGEVLALLERDNFPRFQSALQERDRAGGRAAFGKGGGAAALGQGAPFCVQLVRDGRSVGSLRGKARLLTVGASCCRAETARECRQLESRRQLVSAESSMASLAAAQAMGAGLAGGGAAGAAEGGAMEVEGEGADDLELGSDDDEDLMAGLLQGGSSLKKVEVATGGGTDADLDPGSEMEDEDEEDDDDE